MVRGLACCLFIGVLASTVDAREYYVKIRYINKRGDKQSLSQTFGVLTRKTERVITEGESTYTKITFSATRVDDKTLIADVEFVQVRGRMSETPDITHIRSSVRIEPERPIDIGGTSNEMLILMVTLRNRHGRRTTAPFRSR